jgi:hypothetical protein
MFSIEEKRKISKAVEEAILEINNPEMPNYKPRFILHIFGNETDSWADIEPNWRYENPEPVTSIWNDEAKIFMHKDKNHE